MCFFGLHHYHQAHVHCRQCACHRMSNRLCTYQAQDVFRNFTIATLIDSSKAAPEAVVNAHDLHIWQDACGQGVMAGSHTAAQMEGRWSGQLRTGMTSPSGPTKTSHSPSGRSSERMTSALYGSHTLLSDFTITAACTTTAGQMISC